MPEVRQAVRRPSNLETQILIEALGQREIPGWDERLDLYCCHISHDCVRPVLGDTSSARIAADDG